LLQCMSLLVMWWTVPAPGGSMVAVTPYGPYPYGPFAHGEGISLPVDLVPVLKKQRALDGVRLKDGKPVVTHGPFAETREALLGYYLIDAKDLDQALEIAGRVPSAQIGSIEVRPVMVYN